MADIMRAVALQPHIVTQAEILPGDVLRVRIQKELKNHNSGNRHPHWTVRAREKDEWQTAIMSALIDGIGLQKTFRYVGPLGVPGCKGGLRCRCEPNKGQKTRRCTCPPSLKRDLSMIRWVPSARHFIHDEFDNLPMSCKTLRDAIKGLGLLRDDSSKWCRMTVRQEVSVDGLYWTEFTISKIDEVCP